jgi:hypothetical protein
VESGCGEWMWRVDVESEGRVRGEEMRGDERR